MNLGRDLHSKDTMCQCFRKVKIINFYINGCLGNCGALKNEIKGALKIEVRRQRDGKNEKQVQESKNEQNVITHTGSTGNSNYL